MRKSMHPIKISALGLQTLLPGGKQQGFDYHWHRVAGLEYRANIHVIESTQLNTIDRYDFSRKTKFVFKNMAERFSHIAVDDQNQCRGRAGPDRAGLLRLFHRRR